MIYKKGQVVERFSSFDKNQNRLLMILTPSNSYFSLTKASISFKMPCCAQPPPADCGCLCILMIFICCPCFSDCFGGRSKKTKQELKKQMNDMKNID